MTSIQFYHLLTTPLERALPKLLEKAYGGGFRTLLLVDSEARAEQLNELLWTYDPNSFLPHGGVNDGACEQQPILLSTQLEALNQANLLVVTDGTVPPQPAQFERIVDIFDGNNPESVASARTRWKQYKDVGFSMSYMKQTEKGGWEQKAVA